METDNVLADQMKVCRPVFLKLFRLVSIAVITDSGDIVSQCIQPYIRNVLRIKFHRDPPCKGGSGYAKIL